ncbi:MAG: hypothetical protein JNL19_09675 [Burkholderiales bacterium]|nr:hypothetical protein [Burkholderiales bacterium]
MSHFNPGQPYGADVNGDWLPSAEFASTLASTARDRHDTQWETVELELETITPVFGGGTIAGEIDALAPFRPRAIKNAIRHWWWLLNRSRFTGNPQALYAEMTMLFGGAATRDAGGAGAVRIRATGPDIACVRNSMNWYFPWRGPGPGRAQHAWVQKQGHPWSYALFSAKGEVQQNKGSWNALLNSLGAKEGQTLVPFTGNANLTPWFKRPPSVILTPTLKFSLRLSVGADLDEDRFESVKSAALFWILIGGVGSRTSRGLGALRVTGENTNSARWATTLPIQAWAGTDGIEDWVSCRMPGARIVFDDYSSTNPLSAWESAIDRYKNFRQARQTRRPGGKPARSYWPKVDVLRQLGRLHERDVHEVHHRSVRAEHLPLPELFFGAPIEVSADGRNKCTIGFSGMERYASPLTLRPICIGDRYYAAAFVLPFHSDVDGKSADIGGDVKEYAMWWFNSKAAAAAMLANIPPLRHDALVNDPRAHLVSAAKGATDPIDMFLNYFDERRPGTDY